MNNEYMDNESSKIDLIALIDGMVKSALRLLIPGVLAVVILAGAMGLRSWLGYNPQYQASASFTASCSRGGRRSSRIPWRYGCWRRYSYGSFQKDAWT